MNQNPYIQQRAPYSHGDHDLIHRIDPVAVEINGVAYDCRHYRLSVMSGITVAGGVKYPAVVPTLRSMREVDQTIRLALHLVDVDPLAEALNWAAEYARTEVAVAEINALSPEERERLFAEHSAAQAGGAA